MWVNLSQVFISQIREHQRKENKCGHGEVNQIPIKCVLFCYGKSGGFVEAFKTYPHSNNIY